ncbi:MAG: carbon-nitrogen hydrolase family protein [Clostridiales bacterium]
MSTKCKVALFQMDCKLGETGVNVEKCLTAISQAAGLGCSLIVFPELALSGYNVTSLEEALQFAIPVDSPYIKGLTEACKNNNIYAAVGYMEVREGKVYNSAALLGPEGLLQNYSKMHMPNIGLDKFAEKGQPPLPPSETAIGKISMIVCYDIRFPELTRHFALKGADMVINLTNWPRGSEHTREVLPIARAFENKIYFMSCNRVGDERGSHFIGGSRIVDPNGRIIAQAGEEGEEMITAEIDVALARQKYFFSQEGNWSIDADKDRRPDVFGNIDILTPPCED